MSDQVENVQNEIGFSEIITFVKKYGKKSVVYAGISLAVTLFLLLVIYLIAPKKTAYSTELALQLQKTRGSMVYPSGKKFSANDILSPAVLREVYNNNQLNGKIEFEKFCALFYFSGVDMEKELLTAAYKAKLSNKKITVVEQKNLEAEYLEALRSLETNLVTVSMLPHHKLTAGEEAKILNEVPVAWFKIYSKQEAKQFPRVETVQQLQSIRSSVAGEGWFIVLDKARMACNNLHRACLQLDELLAGQKVALPSGEYLDELRERLNNLVSHRIRPLLLTVQESPAYQSPLDQIFLRAKIIDLQKGIKANQSKYNAMVDAIGILNTNDSAAAGKTTSGAGNAAPLTMNFDGNFFASLSALIRDSQSLNLREQYANSAVNYKNLIAEQESELDYYTEMLQQSKRRTAAAGNITTAQFKKIEESLFSELLTLGRKVNEFRELIYKDYMLDKQFFTSNGEVRKVTDFYIPIKKVAIILLLIWFVLNAVRISKQFYKSYTEGELKN